MRHSSFRGPRIVLFALVVSAAAQAAPLQPTKPLPGPVGPAVPKPPPAPNAGDCQTAVADGGFGIGADASGTQTLTARNHDKDCPSSVIVDVTINPEAARPTTPTTGNAFWSPNIALEVGDARETLIGSDLIMVSSLTSRKACEEYKHTQKLYRRNEGDAASLLVAQGGLTMQWEETLHRCLYKRPNYAFRAAPPPAGKKVYYRIVDTFSNGPTGTVTFKFRHNLESSNTE